MGRLFIAAMMLLVVPVNGSADGEAQLFGLTCEPITAVVPQGWGPEQAQGPSLAVVDADVRPRRTHLVLDGRDLGVVSDFDGIPGHLFLKPGNYRLEFVLQGYATARFEVEVVPGCLYAVKHRMDRIPGTRKAPRWGSGIGSDAQRIYGPNEKRSASVEAIPAAEPKTRGADLSLRPELATPSKVIAEVDELTANLRIIAAPSAAAVYLDGAFVASAAELAAMELPLAVTEGSHQIEVIAPGFEPATNQLTVTAGSTATVELTLVAQSRE